MAKTRKKRLEKAMDAFFNPVDEQAETQPRTHEQHDAETSSMPDAHKLNGNEPVADPAVVAATNEKAHKTEDALSVKAFHQEAQPGTQQKPPTDNQEMPQPEHVTPKNEHETHGEMKATHTSALEAPHKGQHVSQAQAAHEVTHDLAHAITHEPTHSEPAIAPDEEPHYDNQAVSVAKSDTLQASHADTSPEVVTDEHKSEANQSQNSTSASNTAVTSTVAHEIDSQQIPHAKRSATQPATHKPADKPAHSKQQTAKAKPKPSPESKQKATTKATPNFHVDNNEIQPEVSQKTPIAEVNTATNHSSRIPSKSESSLAAYVPYKRESLVRLQHMVLASQKAFLESVAEQLEVSEGEVLRHIIAFYQNQGPFAEDSDS